MTPAPKASVIEKPLTSVMEDYLEAIFDLNQEKKIVRVRDIAKRMDVKMPSVSSMLKTLSDRGLVYYEKYEYIELTKSGTRVGQDMRHKHEVLNRFLTEILKIDAKIADEEACKMEHALSKETLQSLVDFMEFIQACPRAGDSWLEHFDEFRKHGSDPEKCLLQADDFSCSFKQKAAARKKEARSKAK
jgi:DtxR family Mn-dependent transcriptional regulator